MKRPNGLDWQSWVRRWDLMQERYIVKRTERFATIVEMVRVAQKSPVRIIDLGCGTGSLTLEMLKAFPKAQVWGIDFDRTMLWLAEARLHRFGKRIRLVSADLRKADWIKECPQKAEAVVSATALHWLRQDELASLYTRIGGMLRSGGIFLNADHVASDNSRLQKTWERRRREMQKEYAPANADDWDGFWRAYSKALGYDVDSIAKRIPGGWEGGVEEGMPLSWHFDRLRESGFVSAECFWRLDCDAIYGGMKS